MLSIITITHNRAALLAQAMQTVLSQSFKDFEYIVVDDGSDDDTEAVVAGFKDSRIFYHKLARIGKLDSLRNYGIRHSTRPYIAFIDSDDLWLPDKLKIQMNHMEKDPALAFSFCEAEIFNDQQVLYPKIYNDKYKIPQQQRFFLPLITDPEFVIFPSSIVIRRECLEKTGLFNEALICGDKELFAMLAWHFPAILVDQRLLRIRRHTSNISYLSDSFTQNVLQDELLSLQAFQKVGWISLSLHKMLSAAFHKKLGDFFYARKQYRSARKHYTGSLSRRPVQPKLMAKYMLTYINKAT